MGLGGGGRGDVVEKAIYANEEGKACVEGSAAADGTFEDPGGERKGVQELKKSAWGRIFW